MAAALLATLFAPVLARGAAAGAGLTLSVFNNTACAGTPVITRTVPGLSFTLDDDRGGAPLCASLSGTMQALVGAQYAFACDLAGASFATLHVDDHLVCQRGAHVGSQCGPPGSPHDCKGTDNPLPTMSRTALPVRMTVMRNATSTTTATATGAISVAVNVTVSPAGTAAATAAAAAAAVSAPLPPPAFAPSLPALEQQRLSMQQSLREGWGAFYDMSYLDHVLLPHGARVTLALCEVGGQGRCLTEARIDWADKVGLQATVRPGLHAYDRSFSQLHVAVRAAAGGLGSGRGGPGGWCNVSVSAAGGARLLVAAEVVGDAASCAGYALVAIGRTTWMRDNTVSVVGGSGGGDGGGGGGGNALHFASCGDLPAATVVSSRPGNGSIPLNASGGGSAALREPHLAFALGQGSVGLSSGGGAAAATTATATAGPTLESILAALAAARAAEEARYVRFGALAQTKAAVQAAVMWQMIWNPLETGPFAPVIRGNPWGLDKGTASDDWDYVLFDWDNHFGAYMLSLDAKELGYSALITVIKAKTAQGFVANTAAGVNKARHSQPPVGAKVLLEMYRKYKEPWIVALLFDDLLDWNRWFAAERRLAPLNITCLGSAEGDMQDARFESGLDNSPMYDDGPCVNGSCAAWACDGTACGSFRDQKMQLYDVGMASMHAMDSAALATLATAIGRDADAAVLQARADAMAALIEAHLWDEQSGIYVNRLPGGAFNRRVSPTSFYAMQTAAPSDSRVSTMMDRWLLNKDRFCVSPTGDSAGNDDSCYWGLPSISADDAAFPQLGYWRGYVWGPMAQLTYWGLAEYDHVPAARTARKAMCSQMNRMMLEQWRNNGFICENYFPAKGHDGCSPGAMKFYHWGALSGFISIVDEGFY